MLGVASLGGRCAVVLRHCAVRNGLIGLQNLAVSIDPSHGIGVDCGGVLRSIGHIAGDGGICRESIAFAVHPAGEAVGVLGICFLGGCLAFILGRCAVGHSLISLQNCAVLIFPGHGVGVDCGGVLRSIGHIAGDGGICRESIAFAVHPAGEAVGVLGICFLGGCLAFILGRCAVEQCLGLQHRFAILPGDGVGLRLPDGVEGGILGEVDRCAIPINITVAVGPRIPRAKGVMLAGEGVGVQHDGCAAFHDLGIHAALAAVGIKGDGDLFDLADLHPHVLVSVIDIGVACSGGRGIGVGMSRTAVFQEGRVDRDGVINRCSVVLCSLIGVLFGACAIDHYDLAGFVRRDDAGPSRSGKQEAIGFNRTVDIKNHICQISLCTVIGPAGRIA